jgi:rubrerythrin
MNLHEGIGVAIDYERKVRDHYANGAKVIEDQDGREMFALLAREEQAHVDHLARALASLKRDGRIPRVPLKSAMPQGVAWLEEARKKVEARPDRRVATANELELAQIALQLEKETTSFYRELVAGLPAEDRGVFEVFIEIEEGHELLVQALIDSLTGVGFWFDTMELKLENG